MTYIQQVFGVVVKATDLPNTEIMGLSDPFCIVRAVLISGQVVEMYRTKVVNDTLTPIWQEAFQSTFTELDQPLLLLFDLWDEDDPSRPLDDGGAQHLGSAVVPLLSALDPAPRRRRLWLQGGTQRHETRFNAHGVPRNVGGRKAVRQTLKRSQSGIPSIGLIGRQYQKSFSFSDKDAGAAGTKRWWTRMYDAAIQLKQQITQPAEDQCRPILTIELRAYTETKRMPFHEIYEKPLFVHDEDDLEKCLASPDWERSLYTMPEELRPIGGVERGSVSAEDHVGFVYGVIEGATALPTFDQRPPEVYCVVHVISTTAAKIFVHRTRAIKQMTCPQWNEAFYAELPEGFDAARLQLSVYAITAGTGFSKLANNATSNLFKAVGGATGSEEILELGASDDDWFIGRAHADLTTAISGNLLAEEVPIQGGAQPKQEKRTSGFRIQPAVSFEVMIERRLRPRFNVHTGDGAQMIPRRYHLLTRSTDPVQQSLPYLDNSQVMFMQGDDLFREQAAQEVLELAATGTLAMRKGPKPDWSRAPHQEDDSPLRLFMAKTEEEGQIEEPEQKTQTMPFLTTRERLYRKQLEDEEKQAELRNVDFTKRELRRKVRSLPVLKTRYGEMPGDLFITPGYRAPAQAIQPKFSSRQEMKSADVSRILHDKPVFSELLWQKPPDQVHEHVH